MQIAAAQCLEAGAVWEQVFVPRAVPSAHGVTEVPNFLVPVSCLSLKETTNTDPWLYWEVILSYCCKGGGEVVIIYVNTDISISSVPFKAGKDL